MYSSLYREAGLLLLLFCIGHSQLFQPHINSQLLPDAVTQPAEALFVITAKVCLVCYSPSTNCSLWSCMSPYRISYPKFKKLHLIFSGVYCCTQSHCMCSGFEMLASAAASLDLKLWCLKPWKTDSKASPETPDNWQWRGCIWPTFCRVEDE